MKRLLWVVYHFPPSGGAGVQRPVKWIKYLRSLGIAATVITVDKGACWAFDPTLLQEIPPDTHVVRTFSLEPAACLPWRSLRQMAESTHLGTSHAQGWRQHASALASQLRQYVLPDEQVGWIPFACWAGLKALRQQPHHGIVSTCGPISAHVVARTLQRLSGLPWLADFRDSWSRDPMQLLRFHAFHRWLERWVCQQADYCSGATQGIVQDIQQHHSPQSRTQAYLYLPNGYDPADFPQQQQRHVPRRYHPPQPSHPQPTMFPLQLTYVGTLYGQLNLEPLLAAIAYLRDHHGWQPALPLQQPTSQPRFQLQLIGQRDRQARMALGQAMEDWQLAPYITCKGYLPHAQAIYAMQQATVLLLLLYALPGSEHIMTGKIYEYIAAKRPILALIPPGEAQSLLEATKRAHIVHPENKTAIAQTLLKLQTHHQQGLLEKIEQPHWGEDSLYNRQVTARKIGQLWQSSTCSTAYPVSP